MDPEGALFAQTPLNGDCWQDVLAHDDECGGCLELRQRDEPAVRSGPVRLGLPAGRTRNWMVVASAVTIVSTVLAVVSNWNAR